MIPLNDVSGTIAREFFRRRFCASATSFFTEDFILRRVFFPPHVECPCINVEWTGASVVKLLLVSDTGHRRWVGTIATLVTLSQCLLGRSLLENFLSDYRYMVSTLQASFFVVSQADAACPDYGAFVKVF